MIKLIHVVKNEKYIFLWKNRMYLNRVQQTVEEEHMSWLLINKLGQDDEIITNQLFNIKYV